MSFLTGADLIAQNRAMASNESRVYALFTALGFHIQENRQQLPISDYNDNVKRAIKLQIEERANPLDNDIRAILLNPKLQEDKCLVAILDLLIKAKVITTEQVLAIKQFPHKKHFISLIRNLYLSPEECKQRNRNRLKHSIRILNDEDPRVEEGRRNAVRSLLESAAITPEMTQTIVLSFTEKIQDPNYRSLLVENDGSINHQALKFYIKDFFPRDTAPDLSDQSIGRFYRKHLKEIFEANRTTYGLGEYPVEFLDGKSILSFLEEIITDARSAGHFSKRGINWEYICQEMTSKINSQDRIDKGFPQLYIASCKALERFFERNTES